MKCNLPGKKKKTSLKYGKNADPRLVEIVENYDKFKIGLDEPFAFGCKMYGKCCTNREDHHAISSERPRNLKCV